MGFDTNRRRGHAFFAISFALAITALPHDLTAQTCGEQLLLNPGCEEALVDGEILEWMEFRGSTWTTRSSDPPPAVEGGTAYFSPGSTMSDQAELLQQRFLPRTHGSTYSWSALIWTSAQDPSSAAQVLVYIRNVLSQVILIYDTGEIRTGGEWEQHHGTFSSLEPGTSFEFSLISVRGGGGRHGAFFDNAFLAAGCPNPVRPTTWATVKELFR